MVIDVACSRGGPGTRSANENGASGPISRHYTGRHGECPAAVLAAAAPSDCFAVAYEAVRLAVGHMTPVLVLSDGWLASGAEPWRLPDPAALPAIPVRHPTAAGVAPFRPYRRDERLVRPWAVPGAPGLEHRIGGLEKEDGSGAVSYDPLNHERMVRIRAEKIARIADDIPPLAVDGPDRGDLLVVSWGGTFGAVSTAVRRARDAGRSVAHAHLRYLQPMPRNTGDVLRRYRKVLVAELNTGQLRRLLRAEYLLDAIGLNKVQGRPFLSG